MNGPLDPAEARAWLDTHMNLERMVGVPCGSDRRVSPQPLSRMQALVELLGSPQLQYPAIHVTGTNGKTSVARMITALLAADGLSVGTDTSPYLERFNERMSWNGEPIPDDDLDRILVHIATLETPARRPPELLRDHQRRRAGVVRRRRRRRRRHRGGPRRPVGRHQRGRRRGRGGHQRRARPRGVPRPHP